ncbi:TetR family transcriptional regulator C-terminal domain-containing protein [Streptomyces sp. 21So2-11]|uniref:TetR family transcriptional regulator C-terminal domain-containing protein n=1 Tax=Streptomyces sp. 21So2-11 TaxID=3144408 RepID=UPI00321ADF28
MDRPACRCHPLRPPPGRRRVPPARRCLDSAAPLPLRKPRETVRGSHDTLLRPDRHRTRTRRHSLLPTDPELRQDWRLWQELWVRALRDATAQHLAVDLYDQLHTWVSQALKRGIDSGEFAHCDIDATSALLLALCDGFGIRLMLGDPKIDLDSAQAALWGAVAPTLEVPPDFPAL